MDGRLKACLALTLSLFLSACSTSSSNIKPLTDEAHRFGIDETEVELIKRAERAHRELVLKGLIDTDEELNGYLQSIADKISPPTVLSHRRIEVVLVRDPVINAFAMPNGKIYLNYGLVTRMETEDELAFVIAHEMSHIIQRHSYRNMQNRKFNMVSAHVTDLLLLGTGLAYIPFAASISSYSRDQETEADQQALFLLADTGWSPEKSIDALESLSITKASKQQSNSLFSTHPELSERIDTLQIALERMTDFSSRSYPPNNEQHTRLRQKLLVPTLSSFLRNGLYEHVLVFTDELQNLAEKPLLEYYRAEALRLRASNISLAMKEYVALTNESVDQHFRAKFEEDLLLHREEAKKIYQALEGTSFTAKAHRGLGLIESSKGNREDAIFYLKSYLALEGKPRDTLYITRTIERLEGQENES